MGSRPDVCSSFRDPFRGRRNVHLRLGPLSSVPATDYPCRRLPPRAIGDRTAGRSSSECDPLGAGRDDRALVAIESAFAGRWLDFSDPVSLSWRFSTEAARTQASGRDLLCLGDSLAKHGVIPSLIEEESGLRTVNLAAARCPTVMTYFVFRRALDAGAHPAAIVINTKQAVLIGSPDFNARYWPAVLSPWECLELGMISRRPETAAAALVGCLLPSVRSRLEIRSNLIAALGGQTDPLHDINRLLWRNWTVNDGANVASLHSGYRGELAPDIEERLHPSAFFVDRSNAEGIERLLRLAARAQHSRFLAPARLSRSALRPCAIAAVPRPSSRNGFDPSRRSIPGSSPLSMRVRSCPTRRCSSTRPISPAAARSR